MPYARCQRCKEVYHIDTNRVEEWAAVEKDDEGFGIGTCERCEKEDSAENEDESLPSND